ncbi:hypothetical protein V8E55_009058 [Tylopilus felleus]
MKATPSVNEAQELIKDSPGLKKALQDAIDRGRYEDVMSFPILQKNTQQNITDPPQSEGQATFNAFRIPYVANFPQALLKTMGKYFKERRYNNFISIVQSSGTGKSRGVAEAAQIRFAFLFNIRRDVRYFTYPPPGVSVRNYLVKPESHEAQARYAAFLCSLFICAPKRISNVD